MIVVQRIDKEENGRIEKIAEAKNGLIDASQMDVVYGKMKNFMVE